MSTSETPFWGPDFAELTATDPEVADVVLGELDRVRSGWQLVASENFTEPAVLAALGSTLSNKYAVRDSDTSSVRAVSAAVGALVARHPARPRRG